MRVVLADVRGREGFVSKDTVAGGYGSRLVPFSRVSRIVCTLKRAYNSPPSVQMAYLAAIFARAGHEVVSTRGEPVDGDLAVVLSSLVDYRAETAWADRVRTRGTRVGFVGLAASKMPQLFETHADFIINGEPEAAALRIAAGETPRGVVPSEEITDLDSLPWPRWDLIQERAPSGVRLSARPPGGGYPLLASRGCPEFCTYCPHRILAGHRMRSVANVVDELELLCDTHRHPFAIFRDPLFTQDRGRCLAIADEILARGLRLHFECETRLDRLDTELLDRLHQAGLRVITFGVESLSPETLRKAGRRPIPEQHQRAVLSHCMQRGILTTAFYVFGFPQDTWQSIAATIEHSVALGSTCAQFKLLTPYPGTPLWKQLGPRVFERDWQKFDGFTPTFDHPNLRPQELRYLLGAAFTRFYVRPSFLANYLRIRNRHARRLVRRLDHRVLASHARRELQTINRVVTC